MRMMGTIGGVEPRRVVGGMRWKVSDWKKRGVEWVVGLVDGGGDPC
jgi:hypothetical protein